MIAADGAFGTCGHPRPGAHPLLCTVPTIAVNGEQREVPSGQTVAELLGALGLGQAPCAVEVNAALVPKRRHTEQALKDGDKVEIVTLVGGG